MPVMATSSGDSSKHSHSKPRLGRGLSSLIHGPAEAISADDQSYKHVTGLPPVVPPSPPPTLQAQQAAVPSRPEEIRIDDIAPNPYQPRRQFREEELSDLTSSIAAQGILQPLIVARATDGGGVVGGVGVVGEKPFVLIAGERRLRAARQAGLAAVPCIVRQASPQQMIEWALVENIQRADLNPLERAEAYKEYIDRFNLTQVQAGERLGQPRTTVANYLRIIELHPDVKQWLAEGTLSFGHAKLLASLNGNLPKQLRLARKVAKTGLSVRQLEAILALSSDRPIGSIVTGTARGAGKPPYLRDLEDRLSQKLGTRVLIQPGRAKHSGRIAIDYYSLEDFDRISAILGLEAEAQ
jgi:ParB family chromosome partitioning protein